MSDEKETPKTDQKPAQKPKSCWHRIKKIAMWVIISLIILIILIPVLIYLPPVQRFAVDKASKILSEKTGMDVSVGEFRLKFPLDLSMGNVLALQDGDTAVFAENLDVSVEMLPLFSQRIVVDEV